MLGDQIYITRGHVREPDGQRARKLKDLVCMREQGGGGERVVRRSISTCMRNAVAGFSIMWVYKRSRALRALGNSTARPVTHIHQVENTRSGPLLRGLLYEKKIHGVAYLFYQHPATPTIGRKTFWASGRVCDSLRVLTFYPAFLARDIWSNSRKMCQFVGESAASRRSRGKIAWQEEITLYYWMAIIRDNATIDFYPVSR